jgi:glutathione synthase/RimK-type ligase-like ATP-grasp enzyme
MLSTQLIARLGTARWRPARELASALDIGREAGPRYAVQRWRETRALAARETRVGATRYRQIWAEAAAELGAELIELGGNGIFELRHGDERTVVRGHRVVLDDDATLQLALDKPRVHQLLSERGIPIPAHVEFDCRDMEPALTFLERNPGPSVVKPASGSSGSAVTSGVLSEDDLQRAVVRAARLESRILIERQVAGDMYRLLFLEGELLGVVRRRIPRLTGDGRSTVAELIAAENRRRLARPGGTIITVDLDALLCLRSNGSRLASVPPTGATLAVKGIPSQNAFEENETVRGLAPHIVDAAHAAVDALGLRLGGIDLVCIDPARPLEESGGIIVEVNGTPGLHYHYEVADPSGADRVAIPILALLLNR